MKSKLLQTISMGVLAVSLSSFATLSYAGSKLLLQLYLMLVQN